MKRLALIAVLLGAGAGCTPPPPPKPALVETLAILPFDNSSNDLNAPEIMQNYVYQAVLRSPYRPLDIKETNEKLKSVGIVDGGQLPVIDPVKLGRDLGVQALLYGHVESFDYTNVGYYTSRKVNLELKLVDVATGETLWEANGVGANRQLTLDPKEAKANLAAGLAAQAAEKVLKAPLDQEARESTANALRTLPGFRFAGFANDDKKVFIEAGGQKTFRGAIKRR